MNTRLHVALKFIVVVVLLIFMNEIRVVKQGRWALQPARAIASTLDSWQLTTPMTTQRFWHAAVVAGDYLYALGGRPAGTPSNDNGLATVERSQINSDGTLGSWSVLTTMMSLERYSFPAVVSNGYIYAVGGHDNFGH